MNQGSEVNVLDNTPAHIEVTSHKVKSTGLCSKMSAKPLLLSTVATPQIKCLKVVASVMKNLIPVAYFWAASSLLTPFD